MEYRRMMRKRQVSVFRTFRVKRSKRVHALRRCLAALSTAPRSRLRNRSRAPIMATLPSTTAARRQRSLTARPLPNDAPTPNTPYTRRRKYRRMDPLLRFTTVILLPLTISRTCMRRLKYLPMGRSHRTVIPRYRSPKNCSVNARRRVTTKWYRRTRKVTGNGAPMAPRTRLALNSGLRKRRVAGPIKLISRALPRRRKILSLTKPRLPAMARWTL